MKVLKRIACLFLALSMAMGLTACAPRTFDHAVINELCSKWDFTEAEYPNDYLEEYADVLNGIGKSKGVYIHCTGSEAQNIYDWHFNSHDYYEDYEIEEISTFFYLDSEGFDECFVFTFKDPKEAEEMYYEYSEQDVRDGKEGKGLGYTYFISSVPRRRDLELLFGIYLRDNTVLVVIGETSDSEKIDIICKSYRVISPAHV